MGVYEEKSRRGRGVEPQVLDTSSAVSQLYKITTIKIVEQFRL